jgi:hypothetical protein
MMPAKTVWWLGLVASSLFVALLLLNWRYTIFFPKVWRATITVDGRPSSGSSLYRNRWTGQGLFVRRAAIGRELYAFGAGDEKGFVFRCKGFAALVVPGLALSNHEQWGQGCFAWDLAVQDAAGNVVGEPQKSVRRNLRIGGHLLEFTADDGKRVEAEW